MNGNVDTNRDLVYFEQLEEGSKKHFSSPTLIMPFLYCCHLSSCTFIFSLISW